MEQSFLAYLRGRCRSLRQVPLGIGDDAAVLDRRPGHPIVCTDQIIEGVDFDSSRLAATGHRLADVGYKSVAINLSDLAAMGAIPDAALVTLTLPRKNASQIAADVYEGIFEAAAEFDLAIAGGDLSTYVGPLAISVTLTGYLTQGKPWLRSGAREGDAILVSGAVGGSIRGRHLRPTPRIQLVNELRQIVDVHAAIDISDGLSLDLDRLCAASSVGAELDVESIPIHPDAVELAKQTGRTPFEHAWSDGEDFELLLTMDPTDAAKLAESPLSVPVTQIGNIVGRTGLWKRQRGKLQRLSPQGYLHQGSDEISESGADL